MTLDKETRMAIQAAVKKAVMEANEIYNEEYLTPKQLFEQILKVGTTQHFAVVDGDYREELALFCEMMGIEFHDIR